MRIGVDDPAKNLSVPGGLTSNIVAPGPVRFEYCVRKHDILKHDIFISLFEPIWGADYDLYYLAYLDKKLPNKTT